MMNKLAFALILAMVCVPVTLASPDTETSGADDLVVRIAEIEVFPEWLDAYLAENFFCREERGVSRRA